MTVDAKKPLIARRAFFWAPVLMIIILLTVLDGHMIMTARGQTGFFQEPEMLVLIATLLIISSLTLWRHAPVAREGMDRQLFWLGQVLFIYGLLAWSGQFIEAAKMKITLTASVVRSGYSVISLILFAGLPVLCGIVLMLVKRKALFSSKKDISVTVVMFALYFLIVAWLDPASPYFMLELVTEVVVPFIVSAFIVTRIAMHGEAPPAEGISPPPASQVAQP